MNGWKSRKRARRSSDASINTAGHAFELLDEQRKRFLDIARNGSWLNVAKIELSVLCRQCQDRRIASLDQLKTELQAWETESNATPSTVQWRFTTADARTKLQHLYPPV